MNIKKKVNRMKYKLRDIVENGIATFEYMEKIDGNMFHTAYYSISMGIDMDTVTYLLPVYIQNFEMLRREMEAKELVSSIHRAYKTNLLIEDWNGDIPIPDESVDPIGPVTGIIIDLDDESKWD